MVSHKTPITGSSTKYQVLILIVMDNGLSLRSSVNTANSKTVLILIVMDNGLSQVNLSKDVMKEMS